MKIILAGAIIAFALASSANANTDTCVRKAEKLNPTVSAVISG